MFPDTPTTEGQINHIIATGLGLTPRVEAAPCRDGTIEWAAIPGQKVIAHTPFVRHKPPDKRSGLNAFGQSADQVILHFGQVHEESHVRR